MSQHPVTVHLQYNVRLSACFANGAGLDARAAAIVMRVVRNIVNTGRTIACTIHQPAIDIFEVSSYRMLLFWQWAECCGNREGGLPM